MENDRWQAEYQQSVAADRHITERADSSLNNGNGLEISAGPADLQPNICIKDDPENEIPAEEPKYEDPAKYTISEDAKQTIRVILEQVKSLSQIEKFLLYLKLPAEISNPVDPFRHPLNPLGSRAEIYRTICWIRTHLEEDPDISLPKQEVYNGYYQYCEKINIKPLSQADFGKVMKQVYPKVRARRLGTRGNSRYCYSGLRRCSSLKSPVLPDLSEKPLSTETPFTRNNLMSAAWLIVRDWSQQQLGIQFSSLETLAYYLILHHSIGAGTEAATKLTSAAESKVKGEESQTNGKGGNKHREMQLQLQRKIQQKNEGKEKKRKNQTEQKPGCKKSRSHSTPTPSVSSTSPQRIPIGNGGGPSSNSTSPTQGRTVCDNSDFTQLPVLPDFNSFQRPAAVELICADDGMAVEQAVPVEIQERKDPIVELPPAPIATTATVATALSAARSALKKAKYKMIEPRLQEPCDIVTYNPPEQSVATTEPRSQEKPELDRFKDNKSSDDVEAVVNEVCDDVADDFPLTRERLNSVSTVAKDAMDEYLGTNNSQHEHEEELSKYFNNTEAIISTTDLEENTTKLSTLRQLLERNSVSENKANIESILEPSVVPLTELTTLDSQVIPQPPIEPVTTTIVIPQINQNTSGSNHVKRRVSFETLEEPVPPSPNTRRKNFSFTPISPGPPSPSGSHSKCSSTNASPFVSPRNTPISRPKNNTHQLPVTGMIINQDNRKTVKVKKEADLMLEIPPDQTQFNSKGFLPMSAPASPMLSNSSVLHKLLNSDSRVFYKPGYITMPVLKESAQDIASQSIPEDIQNNLDLCRSQSVPLNQMLKNNNYAFIQNVPTEFVELVDPIPEPAPENVKIILNTINEQPCDNNNIDMINLGIAANNQCLPGFEVQLDNNNVELANNFPSASFENIGNEASNPRILLRSQSIQLDTSYKRKCNPSRSVPSTPLSFCQNTKQELFPSKNFATSSRSYPSTPLTSEEAFTYNNINGDCLLNGQPIRTDGLTEGVQFMPDLDINNCDNNMQDKGFALEDEFSLIENGDALMDEDGILIPQNYSGHIN